MCKNVCVYVSVMFSSLIIFPFFPFSYFITSSHLHIFTSSHPQIFKCSHLHLFTSHIFTSSQLCILINIFPPAPYTCTVHVFSLRHLHTLRHLHMFLSQLHISLYYTSLRSRPICRLVFLLSFSGPATHWQC